MPDSPNIAQKLFTDPDFLKLNESDQEHAFDKVLVAKDQDYAKLTSRDRHQVYIKLAEQHHPDSTTNGGNKTYTEMHREGPAGSEPGPITQGAEEVLRTGAYMGGELAGAAGGLLSVPETGPAALAGPAVGGGVATTLADAAIALYNHALFHTPLDLSAKNLLADAGINVGAGLGGGLAVKGIGKVAGVVKDFATGAPGIRTAAKETFQETAKAQEDFLTAQADAERKAIEQNERLKAKAAAELAPQARTARFTQAFGRGGAGAEAARTESAEARIARKQALYKTINEPLNNYSVSWAQRRDALLNTLVKQKDGTQVKASEMLIGTDTVRKAVEQQNKYLAEHQGFTFSRSVQKLIDLASELSPTGEGGAAGLPSSQEIGGTKVKLEDIMSGKHPMSLDMYRQIAQTSGKIDATGGAQAKTLLSMRSLASALSSSSDGANKTAALSIMNSVDKAIAEDPNLNSKLPGFKRLNAEWRDHKELFPDSLRDDITAGTPAQFGPQMFDTPNRALEWLRLAKTPQQKMAMRDMYADYVHDGLAQEKDIDKLIKPVHADFLKVVMPNTPFATREGITHLTTGAMSLEETLASSPEVRQQFMKTALPAMRGMLLDKMQSTTSEAIKQAKRMGPLGEQFIKRVQGAGLDRPAQFRMAIEFMTGSSPDQIAKTVAQGGLPSASATLPRDAAVAAIQGGETAAKADSMFVKRAKSFWPLYLVIGGPVLASGHFNYGAAMLLMGLGTAGSGPIRRAFAQSLENPANARAFWDGIDNPTVKGAMSRVAGYAGRAVMADILSRGGQAGTGVSLEQAPPQAAQPAPAQATVKKPAGYLGS